MPSALIVSNLIVDPIEAWADQSINITFDVSQYWKRRPNYRLPILVNGAPSNSINVNLVAGGNFKFGN